MGGETYKCNKKTKSLKQGGMVPPRLLYGSVLKDE